MTRLVGGVLAVIVACAAFLGGQAIAGGGKDHAGDAKPRSAQAAGSVPEVVARAQHAVALPVLSVHELPSLAAPHRRTPAAQPPVQTVTPSIHNSSPPTTITPNPPPTQNTQPPIQNTQPPAKHGGGGGGSGGSGGGFFDDSG